jgi:hypothetical protein
LGAFWGIAAEPTTGPSPFVLHRTDGADVTGPLRNLGDDWSIGLGGTAPTLTEGANVISLRRKDTPLPAPTTEAQAILANGDRLPGSAEDLAGERLTFRSKLGELAVPLSAVAVIWLAEPAGAKDAAVLRRRLLAEPRKRDVVWLRNGDVVEGTVTRLDKDSFKVEVQGKESAVERTKVAYVAFSTVLLRPLAPKGAYGHLVLADGTRLGIVEPQGDARTLTAKTLFGAAVKVPVGEIVALDLRQGKAVYLSDLKPSSYEYTPYASGLTWPYILDGAVEQGAPAGRDLCLGGTTFDKGLGLHSACRISYALAGGFRRFEALVGLDAGSARLKVLLDGKEHDLTKDKDLTDKDAPMSVRLDVTGVKELKLVVDFGRGAGGPRGRLNWADARLIR